MPQRRLVEIGDELTVLCCRASSQDTPSHDPFAALAVEIASHGVDVAFVGARPGKEIDVLLKRRVLVIGDDADLAAVVLRLLRTERLGTGDDSVAVGYLTPGPTPFSLLWGLPVGIDAPSVLTTDHVTEVPVIRNDVGGVMIGEAEIAPLDGTVYVDARRVLLGAVHRLRVHPERQSGLTVTLEQRRRFGLGTSSQEFTGRATSIGAKGMTVISDGVPTRRPMDRWTFYLHTERLQLLRP